MVQLRKAQNVVQAISAMVDASMLATKDAATLTSLVQRSSDSEGSEDLTFGAPDPAAYKSHTGNLIETLEGLLDKAKAELAAGRNKETSALHNFEMLQQSLQDEIKFAKKDMAQAKKDLFASKEALATAEGDLAVTEKDLAEDEETLKTLHSDCMEASQDFEAETKSRGEELNALAEAKKVIAEATAGADAVTYGLLQESQSGLRSGVDLANFEAVRFVRNLAQKNHSPELAQLASRMAAAMRFGATVGDDPFAKVKGLIRDMIETLLKDAESDATHKAYCDKELGETQREEEGRGLT